MHSILLKNCNHRLCLPHKPQQIVEFQQNIKQFSCLLKSTNSSNNSIPLSSLFKKEQVTQTNCTFDVHLLDNGCRQFRDYSINFNKSSGDNFEVPRFFSDLIKRNCRKFSNKMAPILAPTVKLNNGYEMPIFGLGTYELKKQKCENAIREALKIGYRHIDTAYLYRNEMLIGKILKETFEENTIKREELFLVTKLWCTYHESKMVKYACKKQMEALNVQYIDLYLMHSPIGYKYEDDEALMPHKEDKLQTNDIDYVDTYKAMEELVALGWVRSLGLSNFNTQQMQRILDNCQIKPVTNQVELHPALNQHNMRTFCKQHDIYVTAYSPLARPKPSKPLPLFYESEDLKKIAEKYGKTKAQIVLRYLIDIGTVPIPKSSRPERLLENINIFDFHLSSAEIAIMNSFDTGLRLWRNEMAKFHQYWPFNED
ncbi:1,5-anhydro-D-fructose reductase-like isoform X2 [Calliphora vicina]|uniref:1,5-anhydro-D-fructose reductase-like isoform X2 n=1 Tax=Calliphora vicina TaxID=7373 RepID=UPI00325BCDA1